MDQKLQTANHRSDNDDVENTIIGQRFLTIKTYKFK